MFKYTLFILLIILSACGTNMNDKLKNDPSIKAGNLEFYETYELPEIQLEWKKAQNASDVTDTPSGYEEIELIDIHSKRLTFYVIPSNGGGSIGMVKKQNLATVDSLLKLDYIKAIFPSDLCFMWSFKPEDLTGQEFYELYAIRLPIKNQKTLNRKDIKEARTELDRNNASVSVLISMTEKGSEKWAEMTKNNINRHIAITMDNKVFNAPLVMAEINGGNTQISGPFTVKEAETLAARINKGK